MKNSTYNFDFATKTLTITKEFADNANIIGSSEYMIVKQLQNDFPNMVIEKRTHKTPSKYHNSNGIITVKNQFNNLSYDRMEHFIKAIPNSEKYLSSYEFIKDCGNYSLTAKWFMKQFPAYRTNPLFYLSNTVDVIDFSEIANPTLNEKDA